MIKDIIKACRPHQWVKNILVFAPLILSHRYTDLNLLKDVFLGFLSFCFCASAIYIVNDLKDVAADKMHPVKSKRPFASGSLSAQVGFILVFLLVVAAYGLGSLLPIKFGFVVLIYFVVANAYTYVFKEMVILDVIVLALLYTLRIFAGAKAADVVVSKWFMMFSIFLFVMLAFVKRYNELARLKKNDAAPSRRGYRPSDIEQLSVFGTASGYIAVMVLALYISSPDVVHLYRQSQYLWLLCPLALYWISRFWLLVHRGNMEEDPLRFTMRDVQSYAVAILAVLLVFMAV